MVAQPLTVSPLQWGKFMLCEFYLNKKINIKSQKAWKIKFRKPHTKRRIKRDEKQRTIRLTYQSRGTSIQVTRQRGEGKKN